MSRASRVIWILSTFVSLAGGAAALGFFSLPFAAARHLADGLAPDGSFERLTPALFAGLRPPARLAGGLALLAAAGMASFPRASRRLIERGLAGLIRGGRDFYADARVFGRDLRGLRPGGWTLAGLLLLTLAGAMLRLPWLWRPFYHDEAYTYVGFVDQGLRFVLTNYHAPNNHVLHTIFVYLSTRAFGPQPWAVRLPACLAGVLLVPGAFLLARRLYGAPAAFLVAGILAGLPAAIDYASNARGYSQLALIGVLTFGLGVYVKRHRNRCAWAGLALAGAAGFYTLPMMLFPFGILCTWLFLSALARDVDPAYGSLGGFLRWLIPAGVLTALVSVLLYLPLVRGTGLDKLVANNMIQPLAWPVLREVLPGRMRETWGEWTSGLPAWLAYLLAAGAAAALAFHRRIARDRVPLLVAALLFLAADLVLQRPNPWPRVNYYLMPLFFIWAVAGLTAPFAGIHLRRPAGLSLAGGIAAAGVAAALLAGGAYSAGQVRVLHVLGEAEAAVLMLKGQLAGEDVVVVAPPADAVVWYYAELHGIPSYYTGAIKSRPFSRAFVVVNPGLGQTVEGVIRERGPDLGFIDLATARLVWHSGGTWVYSCLPYRDRLRAAYGRP